MPPVASFDRGKLEDLLKQKFFYDQSFAIYGGVQGLYDYGPMGCAMKANLLSAWRQHFVLEDQLLEVDCSMLTPAPVLQASGHVERFADLMVKDIKTGECFRADHLIKSNLEAKQKHKKTSETEKTEIQRLLTQVDNLSSDELNAIIRRYDMRSPATGNELSEPQQFNLMFETMIGPTGQYKGYLRPETAQGIFVNFQRLLRFNQGRIPFGAAQIGSAFRNEISPRSGLIRVREFAMAEIEYFVDPSNKQHPKFEHVRDVEMNFYSACDQMDGRPARKMTVGEAVQQRIVANETLGYFMARIHLFLLLVGVDQNRLRFRQHLSNEMAHYACDCWDAECQTSYGWIECVGCADRSCYDLLQHTKATGTRLVAEKRLSEPRSVQVCECTPNKQALGKVFRADTKKIADYLAALSLDEACALKSKLEHNGEADLSIDGRAYTIDNSMVHVREYENIVHVEEFVPNVIEPSFGIGRILYTIFEHSFRVRDDDEQRTYLSVNPTLAPYKCSVLPLSNHPDFFPFIRELSGALTRLGVTHRIDESSGSIGRRYARTDQIAIPYGITVDFDTVHKSPASATLRERDSMRQIRVPLDELPTLISDLSNGVLDWSEAQSKYPAFEQQETGTRVENKKDEQPRNTLTKIHQLKSDSAAIESNFGSESNEDKEPAVAVEDWLSVSDEIDDTDRKCEVDVDNWSSATETADGEARPIESELSMHTISKSKVSAGCKKNQRGTSKNQEHSTRPSSQQPSKPSLSDVNGMRDSCEAKKKNLLDSVTHGTHKKPINWIEWGKAIRRHYQEEEIRDKHVGLKSMSSTTPAPVVSGGTTFESDEARSNFSGYEADQEDNAVCKSFADHHSSLTKENDTTCELSPTVQSICEESTREKISSYKFTDDAIMDTEFPPLKSTVVPNHGLFVGTGWPGEKPVRDEKPLAKNEPLKIGVADKSGTGEHKPNSSGQTRLNVCQPKELGAVPIPEKTDWPSVMARIFEQTCEPEMWHFNVHHTLPTVRGRTKDVDCDHVREMDVRSKSENNEPTVIFGKAVDDTLDEESQTVDTLYHGLFKGPGWPRQKRGENPDESQKKSEAKRIKDRSTNKDVDSGQQAENESDNRGDANIDKSPVVDGCWQSVIAKLDENSLMPDMWQMPTAFDLNGLGNRSGIVHSPLETATSTTFNANEGTHASNLDLKVEILSTSNDQIPTSVTAVSVVDTWNADFPGVHTESPGIQVWQPDVDELSRPEEQMTHESVFPNNNDEQSHVRFSEIQTLMANTEKTVENKQPTIEGVIPPKEEERHPDDEAHIEADPTSIENHRSTEPIMVDEPASCSFTDPSNVLDSKPKTSETISEPATSVSQTQQKRNKNRRRKSKKKK
ncbi:glycyl-tRNA synthetase [Paragonimus westermani]|uniref:Glycine--tRNA ligase n=1 Tax=Paragonimus westermani TaxID=34504 RepID=A0A5J4NYI1_9TREM|nr:glycyl-tRNA synthetase [Paragonimus westermani]